MTLYEELKTRGLLYQTTDEEELKKSLDEKKITIYTGTDPTADSLHIGHCVPACIMRRFQQAGHRVIILVGGATAQIGDPTGKTDMRNMLTQEQLEKNVESIKKAYSKFLDFEGKNKAEIVNNADWFKGYDYISFLRDVGVHFNVSKMLSNDIYAKRIESGGLTFFEMGYMLMQAYDFVYLNKEKNCTIQWGGADQWGNIVAGVELGRKLNFVNDENRSFIGATNPLLLTPDGKKMGKTEKGAIWIDNEKISAYDFYQGIYQTPDGCVRMMFALFTDLSMQEVDKMIFENIVSAKKRLCYEITKFIRGEEDAVKAQQMSENLFVQGGDDAPEKKYCKTEFKEGKGILELLVQTGLCSSNGDARRIIDAGGILLNNEKITDWRKIVKISDFENGSLLLKKGKKSFVKVVLK